MEMRNAWLKFGIVIVLSIVSSASADQKKLGAVPFNHDKHIAINNKQCGNCHEDNKIGKITDFDKKWAHNVCHGCHDVFAEGPTECAGCHAVRPKGEF